MVLPESPHAHTLSWGQPLMNWKQPCAPRGPRPMVLTPFIKLTATEWVLRGALQAPSATCAHNPIPQTHGLALVLLPCLLPPGLHLVQH